MGTLLVLILFKLFINSSAQWYYSPCNNVYPNLLSNYFLQEQCARQCSTALNQCTSYVQYLQNHFDSLCAQRYAHINVNKDKVKSQNLDSSEEATNRDMFSDFLSPMPYPIPVLSGAPFQDMNPYWFGGFGYPSTTQNVNRNSWLDLMQQILNPMQPQVGRKNQAVSPVLQRNKNTSKYTDIKNHPNWNLFDNDICGDTSTDRIIGGEEAQLGQFPWLALLGYLNSTLRPDQTIFSCGAALINSCWVITAAHCISNLPGDYYLAEIRLGEHSLNDDIDCDSMQCADPPQRFVPQKIIAHKYFNKPKQKNDIGLIKLHTPAIFTRWVIPICLPRLNLLSASFVGKAGDVAGWGIDNIVNHHSSKILLTVKLTGTSITDCQSTFTKTDVDEDSQMCFGGFGKDSCNGDSGGPLMKVDAVDGETPKYYIFGIVSFGAKDCGKKDVPAVYTKIAYFVPWILNKVTQC